MHVITLMAANLDNKISLISIKAHCAVRLRSVPCTFSGLIIYIYSHA
jgi:hypothetical protein